MSLNLFDFEYKRLNTAQKEAVDTIDGPVMVVAGPGTGKTQVLALRIGNILKKTDTKADSILCLTFTNSGVKAMRERLRKYIGPEAGKVKIATFHSFGMNIIEKYFLVLGLDEAPKLMDDKDAIALCDDILENNDWEYIRPRGDTARYFRDLKSLISLLKRERLSPENFEKEIKKEIKSIESDPANISSRGVTKGEFKKEVIKKIESLIRTLEAVKFFELYEVSKKEKNVFDYDDVLENLVKIVEESDDALEAIKVEYQYVLIDEHQDSSGVQNEFLETVWGEVEQPNIFVVGDDRQLIYGFGGASLEYFENFKHTFGKAKLITLVENYRSTQKILDLSHKLLKSSLVEEKLKSNIKENHSLKLVEADYPRDEILAVAIEISARGGPASGGKDKIDFNDMAILVPKNRHVRSTMTILRDMGIPVAQGEAIHFFDTTEAQALIRVLKILANPENGIALSASFFDKHSGVSPIKAYEFIRDNNMREFSLLSIKEEKNTLFDGNNEINNWIQKLKSWLSLTSELNLYSLIQKMGSEFLLEDVKGHEELTLRVEVVRTMLHLVLMQIEKTPKLTLKEFLEFIDRIESYGENIPLAVFSKDEGVRVLTLHGSKGLEFDFVWIAHMDERSFSGSRKGGFSVPESIEEKVVKKDQEVQKRELYVAITRAKRFCTVSYALHSYTGFDQELAQVVADIEENFEKENSKETEEKILAHNPKAYVEKIEIKKEALSLTELKEIVKRDYEDRKMSVSLLNNFFECPWKWYFRNLLQLPEPKSESLEFGNIIHGSIDMILKLNKKPTKIEIENIIKEQIKKSAFGTERKQEEFLKLGFNVISKWVENRLGEINKNIENEQSVSVSDNRFPNLNIYGKIDLIEHLPARNAFSIVDTGGDKENEKGNVRVTDFKTGNPRKKSDIEKIDDEGRMSGYMRQLAMYSYLLITNKKWNVNVTESRLEFVEAKKEIESFYNTVITSEQIDMIVRDIQDYNELLKTGQWTERPCNFNSYGKPNAVCEYCKMAEIYNQY